MAGIVRILDVPVDAVTLDDAVRQINAAIDERTGRAEPFRVATVNPEFVMRARRDPGFREALERSSLRVADGAGLMIAGRLLGLRLPERVTGVDLVHAVARSAAARGDRLFLLGAAPGVAQAAARRLERENPTLQIAGAMAGSPGTQDDASSIAAVREAEAAILLVAYGAPAQELWLARNLSACGAAVGIGVGGTFDYLSGRVARAPAFMRRAGLEWLYRLVRQPWRARRQLALPVFMLAVLKQRAQPRTA